NGLWDDYVARVTGVSPAVASDEAGTEMAAADESVSEETSELSLLLPGEGDSESTGTGDTGDVDELRTKLALADEELEASRIENQELESRISELQARLSKVEELQKMVEIEDDSLAQIQAEQAAEPVEEAAEVVEQTEEAAASDSVNEAIQADEEALLEEILAEEAAAQAQEQAVIDGGGSDEMVDDQAPSDEMVSDEAMPEDSMPATMTEDAVAESASDESETSVPPPAPVIVTPPAAREPSMFDGILPPDIIDMIPSMPSIDGLLADPLILAIFGVLVVLLLVIIVLKRRKSSSDDESGITVSGDDDLFAGEDEEELTPIHLADGLEVEETDIKVPTEEDFAEPEPVEAAVEAEQEDEFGATAVISATDMPEPEAPAPTAASSDQDDVLNEVDVYLAYGLYDNAEELLNSNLTENPERADYRSKLLDTYFATKNVDSFVKEAEKLKSMGDIATGYWDRVQIMGYELAPDNALFSDAKDSGLSAADLEITKPQEADFDLGASEDDDTNFSTTDFNLGEEDTGGDFSDTSNMGEAGEIAATQQIPQIDELPELSDDDDTNLRDAAASEDDTGLELPDDIGEELEFSMDAGDDAATAVMGLPDDFDLDDEVSADDDGADLDVDDIAMDFDIEEDEVVAEDFLDDDIGTDLDAPLSEFDDVELDDDALELGLPDEDDGVTGTVIVTPNYDDTEVVPQLANDDGKDESEINLGMEDTAMQSSDETSLATDELNLDTAELKLPTDEEDFDDEDISIIDFGGEDFVEPTDIIESIDDD
ncbi:MAG: hypothetical protein GY802_01965, partial [Gammaproteobacteria bacterium]|nr:hypothetical protein [Gammaproteobacteria bacterium]